VRAPAQDLARQIGDAAEYFRQEKALLWLGRALPPWPDRCPIEVKLGKGNGGATSFAFDQGQVLGQAMTIQGRADRLLVSVLPHEVTHTIFAAHFRRPLPRWADEGGAVLSEDDLERGRQEAMNLEMLQARRQYRLRDLFGRMDYPKDAGAVMALYCQGYSVTAYLVELGDARKTEEPARSGRQRFVKFVWEGLQKGWDRALQQEYGLQSVEALEQDWIAHCLGRRRAPGPRPGGQTPPPPRRPDPEPANTATPADERMPLAEWNKMREELRREFLARLEEAALQAKGREQAAAEALSRDLAKQREQLAQQIGRDVAQAAEQAAAADKNARAVQAAQAEQQPRLGRLEEGERSREEKVAQALDRVDRIRDKAGRVVGLVEPWLPFLPAIATGATGGAIGIPLAALALFRTFRRGRQAIRAQRSGVTQEATQVVGVPQTETRFVNIPVTDEQAEDYREAIRRVADVHKLAALPVAEVLQQVESARQQLSQGKQAARRMAK